MVGASKCIVTLKMNDLIHMYTLYCVFTRKKQACACVCIHVCHRKQKWPPPQYPTPLHYVTISTVQAQELITRLQRRELYKSVDEITIPCEVSNEECGARGGGL